MKRHKRWRGYVFVLAPLLVILTAFLSLVTNVAAGIMPKSWAWTHNSQIVWILGAALLVVIVLIGIILQLISAGTNADGASREDLEAARSSIKAEGKSQTTNLIESPGSTVVNATGSTINFGQQINATFGHNPVNPEHIWNIPPRLGLFCGRDLLISRLHDDLSPEDTPSVCTLFGLGGVGKDASGHRICKPVCKRV